MTDGYVVNPFRATIVWGRPGKSYAVVNNYIRQMISKGYSYIYDYKFDDPSVIAYNTLLNNMDKYKVKPKFYVINFDAPRKSHRCNPINPEFMTDISAYEASYTIMLNLNKTWIEKQEIFVESPIILLAAIIWYLKILQTVFIVHSTCGGTAEQTVFRFIYHNLFIRSWRTTTLYGRSEIGRKTSSGDRLPIAKSAHQNDFSTALLGNDG